ncbi:CaiB/BaiF CoA transferase family protein [Mycolicibacterium vaccae]|uniref:CaiB/BaiF CoA transferase family protein n=1 Tax=Mycolicibacterium vaccae TaxID=1810 RepID=UPI003CF2890D
MIAVVPSGHELPLAGVRVLDFTRILSGPYCTQFLAELGAEIIKIERPGVGDDTRSWGPPFIDGDDQISAYFAALNRGKFSVAIDFTDSRGRELLHRLVAHCDVVIENFRPGVAERYGLDHATLAAHNPAVVTCAISGFGRSGPYAGYPGTEIVVEGMSGLMSVTGSRNGEPARFGIAMTDIATGLTAAGQIIAALGVARSTGSGTHIDTSLYETAVGVLGTLVASVSVSGEVPGRWGSHHPSIVPYGGFPTADGDVITGTVNDRMWPTLCRTIGAEHLLDDPELSTNAGRVRQRDRVETAIAEATSRFKTEELTALLLEAGLLAAPIRTVADMVDDPATHELGVFNRTDQYPGLLTSRLTGPGVDSGTGRVPEVGADTARVLAEHAGLGQEEFDQLHAVGVL